MPKNRNKLQNRISPKPVTKINTSKIVGGGLALAIILIGFFVIRNKDQGASTEVDFKEAQNLSTIMESKAAAVEELNEVKEVSIDAVEEAGEELAEANQLEEVNLEQNQASSQNLVAQASRSQNAAIKSQASVQALKTTSAVQFANMTASVESNAGKLAWSTLMERNSKYFEIERSLDDEAYSKLGKVDAAGLGQTSQEKKYEFFDKTLGEVQMPRVFYRIKQVGVDGKTYTSEPIEYQLGLDIGLYAKIEQMDKEKMLIRYAADVSDSMQMRILKPSGVVVEEQRLWAEFDPQLTQINTKNLESGTYYLQLKSEGNTLMEPFVLGK